VALTDEQRAMLQLLLEGGQGYEDIGSLLGIGPDQVRSRARSALREMGGADPDARVGLSDYILGQADPIGRADAVRHLQADPEANALAQRLVAQLRLLAPKARLPDLPEARGGRAPVPPPPPTPPAEQPGAVPPAPSPGPAPATPSPKRPGLASRAAGALSGLGRASGKRRTQVSVLAAGALAVVIVAIVLISGSADGDGGSDCVPLDTSAAQQAGIPTVALNAVGSAAEDDCPPSGQMTLSAAQPQGNQTQNQTTQFALQANAVHLSPTTSDERYLLWLYTSDDQAFPLGQQTVDASGNLTGGVPLNAQQVLLLPAFQTIRFSKVTAQEAQQVQQSLRSLQQQGRNARGAVPFVGAPVLEGQIAELGLDQLLQQAQGQAGAGGQQGGQGAGQGGQGAGSQ
jgi:hypothetical protein